MSGWTAKQAAKQLVSGANLGTRRAVPQHQVQAPLIGTIRRWFGIPCIAVPPLATRPRGRHRARQGVVTSLIVRLSILVLLIVRGWGKGRFGGVRITHILVSNDKRVSVDDINSVATTSATGNVQNPSWGRDGYALVLAGRQAVCVARQV